MIKKRAFLGILFTAALLLATGCVRESNDANKHFNPADYPDPEAAAQPEAVEYDSNFDLSNVETEAATDLKGTCWLFEESKSVPISYGSGSGTGTGTGTGTGSGEGTGNGNGSSEESLYEFSKVKTGVTGTSTDNVTEEKPYIAFDKDDNFYYYGKQVTISTYQGTWEEVQVNKVLKSTGGERSQYEYPGVRNLGEYVGRRLDAVLLRHFNVHDDDIGKLFYRLRHGFHPVFRLADYVDVAFRAEKGGHSDADDGMVVGDKD